MAMTQETSNGPQFVLFVFLGLLLTFLFMPLLCTEAHGQQYDEDDYRSAPDTLPPYVMHPHYGGLGDGNDTDYAPDYSAEHFTHPRAILAEVQRVETDTLLAARYVGFQGRPMDGREDAASPGGGEADWLFVCYERQQLDWNLHHDDPLGGSVTTGAWVPIFIENAFTYPEEAWRDSTASQAQVRACADLINPRDQ